MQTTINTAPETVYVGYTATELAEQRAAWSEAMCDLARLRMKWRARQDRTRLEQAVTVVAASLVVKGPIAPGRELPFLLERRIDRSVRQAPASGIRRVTPRKRGFMSMGVAAALAAIIG